MQLAIDVLRANYEDRTRPPVLPAPDPVENNPVLKAGLVLHTSWGYDMTMNDFCRIVEVSKTGKTVKCRMVKTVTDGGEWAPGGGKARASNEMYGPEFRLHVRKGWKGEPALRGSYPFSVHTYDGKESASMRKGFFSLDHGGEYYENHLD